MQKTFPRFFSTFNFDQVAKIYRDCWEERLKNNEMAKSEIHILDNSEYGSTKSGNFTNICKISRLGKAITLW